jgi:hypothetical protein
MKSSGREFIGKSTSIGIGRGGEISSNIIDLTPNNKNNSD